MDAEVHLCSLTMQKTLTLRVLLWMPHHRSVARVTFNAKRIFQKTYTDLQGRLSKKILLCSHLCWSGPVWPYSSSPRPAWCTQLQCSEWLTSFILYWLCELLRAERRRGKRRTLLRSPLLMKAKTMTNAIILGASRPEDRVMNPPIHAHLPFTIPSIYFKCAFCRRG